MQNMRITLNLAFMAIAAACISVCQISCSDAFGAVASARLRADKTNLLRATIGLRQIGTTWICYRSNHGLDEWMIDPKGHNGDKCAQYDHEGKLLWEEDSYASGRSVLMDDQTVEELLVMHYDHISGNAEIHYIGNDPVVQGIVDSVSSASNAAVFAAGDKVLKGWKLSRL